MSLLADMLSKAGEKKSEVNKNVDIPPSLKRTVSDHSQKEIIRKKIIIVSGVSVLLIVSGIAGMYLTNTYLAKQHSSQKDIDKTVAYKTEQAEPVTEKLAIPSSPLAKGGDKEIAAQEPATSDKDKKGLHPSAGNDKVNNRTAVSSDLNVLRQTDKTTVEKPKVSATKSKKKSETVKALPLPAVDAASLEANSVKASDVLEKTANNTVDTSVGTDIEKTEKKDIAGKNFYLHMAKAAENRKNYSDALAHYMSILYIEPQNHVIMNNISNIFVNMGSFNEAIKYSEKALAIKKDHVPSLVNLGIAHIKLQNFTKGTEYLLNALSIEPSNRFAIFNTALLYENISNYDNAAEQFRMLYNMGDVDGYLGLGRVAERKGRISDAIKFYKEVLSLNEVDPKIKLFANERIRLLEDIR
ncbi:MAG: tetratricopeptide repeat protein [Deltaproteobacteria bacterium]|nr:tetratricopeptide repeat protein [Deltaproteobacteria bacterium]